MALLASRKYLDSRSETIQEALQDIISDEQGLTTEHIRRVTELANSSVLRGLLSTERTKTIGFPLARADDLIQSYENVVEIEPVKAAPVTDYDMAPKSVLSTPEIEPKTIQEKLHPQLEQTTYQKAADLYETCKVAEEWVSDELHSNGIKFAETELDLCTVLKELMLSGDLPIPHIEKLAGDRPDIMDYLRKVIVDLNSTGELYMIPNIKHASAVEHELDSEHPVIRTLDEIMVLKQKLDALADAVDILRVKKDRSRQIVEKAYEG
jgi:hypothetical protein